MVEFDFAAKRYVQDGVAVAFDDIFTYTRASSATFTNRRAKKNGGYEYFLDTDYVGSVENLATYSEDLTDADWVKSSLTVTGNAVIAPDGSMSADKLTESNGASYKKALQNFGATLNATMHIFSIQVKSAGRDWVLLRSDNLSKGAYFNISAGTLGTDTSDNGASITYMGNGWYECSISLIMDGVSDRPAVYIAAGNGNGNYQGDGVSGIYVWGAQVTESAKVLPYVKTLDVAVTKTFAETLRTEYDAVTGENLGALIEGSSTNLFTYSESMGSTGWSTGTLDTVLQNVKKAPDGTLSMNSITSGATVGSSYIAKLVTLTAGATYTVSVYASSNDTFTTGNVVKAYSPSNGSLGNITLVNAQLTNKVKRYSVTFTVQTTETHYLYFAVDADANTTIEVWGAQLEALPFASSYIRTDGSAVSRSKDVLSVPVTSIPAPSLEQTIVANFDIYGRFSNGRAYEVGGSGNGRRHIYVPTSGTDLGYRYQNASTTIGLLDDKVFKTVSSFDGTSVKFYSNKELAFSISPTELGNSSTVFKIGSNALNTEQLNGHISKFKTYAQALTAQEITLL